MVRALCFTFAAALLAPSCMAGNMDHGNAQMGQAVSDAQAETSRHADLCSNAASMSDATTELNRHEQAMNGIMERMDGAMGTMHGMSCSGMDGMMQTVSKMKSEMQMHRDNMGTAADVGAAHDECGRHRQEMMGLCSSASSQNDGMSCM